MPTITFLNDRVVESADPDATLLETSLKAGIPHAHACGGNARCSTCRVMVLDGLGAFLPRNQAEASLAAKKGFEPNIRLACQSKVTGPVRVRRLVLDDLDLKAAIAEAGVTSGREEKVVILFSDIQDYTSFSERQLPYDVIHILNRYFKMMGEAVLQHHGFLDKYIGDGMMALFGIEERDPAVACLDAVRAGLQMQAGHVELNQYLKRYFDVTFTTRIGIHYGEAVIGEMGHPQKQQFTAIGDSVNVASRIESAGHGTSAHLLISETVHAHVQPRVRTGLELAATLKGKRGTFRLYEVLGLAE
jgi:adenylate cyclase